MLLFDIGANRGDAVVAGLNKGYKVVALEAAPKIYRALEANFRNNPNVKPLKFAVAETDFQTVKFYECVEDGLSTLNIDWLTSETMPYNGKQFSTVEATTITIDTLVKLYGAPDLIKIDVEGAEWSVFNGMTQKYGKLAFEWTFETIREHEKQLDYLYKLGYK
jgi:FkbM family methyltransferase